MEVVPVAAIHNGSQKYHLNQQFPLLAYGKNAYLRKSVDTMIHEEFDYRIIYETDNAGDLRELALQGLGVAWLPRLLVEEEIQQQRLQILADYLFFENIYIIRNKVIHSQKMNSIWNALTH